MCFVNVTLASITNQVLFDYTYVQIASVDTEVGVKVDAMARCFLLRDEAFLIAAVD